MIEDLTDLLERQTQAATVLETRLRALELVVAAGEYRFLSLSVEEVESAAEHLSGLELTRALVLSAAGYPPEASAEEIRDQLDGGDDQRALLSGAIDALRAAMQRVHDARARSDAATQHAMVVSQQRVAAAEAFAAV